MTNRISLDELRVTLIDDIESSLKGNGNCKFTYIIGANGTGKSRQLAMLAQHFGGRLKAGSDSASVVGCIANSVYDRFVLTEANKIAYRGARTTGNAVFHTAIDRQLAQMITTHSARTQRSVSALEENLHIRLKFRLCKGKIARTTEELTALVDKRKAKNKNLHDELGAQYESIIYNMLGKTMRFADLGSRQTMALDRFLTFHPAVQIWVQRTDESEVDADESTDEVAVPFSDLSTGEQNRILTFAKVLSVARTGALILIDEPEISLHLHWQMNFHAALKDLVKNLRGLHIVIATHSPTIISEGAKNGDKDSKMVDLQVAVSPPEESPLMPNLYSRTGQARALVCSFDDVHSHDDLVLNQFHTATYRTPSVQYRVARLVMAAVEGERTSAEVIESLMALLQAQGLGESANQVRDAITLIEHTDLPSLSEELLDEDEV